MIKSKYNFETLIITDNINKDNNLSIKLIIMLLNSLFQQDTMNFALYSSNWTAMSVNYKKMLLFTMRMNDAEKLKLKISLRKIVNLEMFASVRIILSISCAIIFEVIQIMNKIMFLATNLI